MRYLGQRHVRQDQQVHMIGHDDPSLRLIEPLLVFTVANRFHYLSRDPRITQPWLPMVPGQRTILSGESMAWCRINDVERRHG